MSLLLHNEPIEELHYLDNENAQKQLLVKWILNCFSFFKSTYFFKHMDKFSNIYKNILFTKFTTYIAFILFYLLFFLIDLIYFGIVYFDN
jgi:hypothetical protein